MSLIRRVASAEAPHQRQAPVQQSGPTPPRPAQVTTQPRAQSAVPPELHTLVLDLARRLDTKLQGNDRHVYRSQLLALVDSEARSALVGAGITPTADLLRAIVREVMDELNGFGPLQPLLDDPSVSEIMVNGPDKVWVERNGKLHETEARFRDDEHVMQIIRRIIEPLGRKVDVSTPMVDARLPDGSRVNAIIPPCSLLGPVITIRKFSKVPLTVDQLISFGSLTRGMADFLRACVAARLNIVVSGGTGSGKTTLLNVLSSYIPDGERIVTIEDAAELKLNQRHVVPLESRPRDAEGNAPVLIRDLVINGLRMRPDRIVVGECRGKEALDMLQAMNTGHDGSLTTLHANSPRDALSRLETMSLMAGMDLPLRVIREQIASAVDLIVQQSRLRDGTRKITHVTEVQGMEGDKIVMQDIFVFEETGVDANGLVIGELRPTGTRPKFYDRLVAAGEALPATVFGDPMRARY
ncbi:MAG: CpaF family protein [Chloroflexota bacterium]|nr:CpaF family protein [Chloroflexota bacterium]